MKGRVGNIAVDAPGAGLGDLSRQASARHATRIHYAIMLPYLLMSCTTLKA